ncbi:MAG: hypothetical protein SGI84_13845 [Gemmatimonadota bacterium]|nr:hypothetical protein [Gemmatimonadota bacterium]
MTDQSRDWDKELAEIDKLMGKAPAPAPAPPAKAISPGRPASPPAAAPGPGTPARATAGPVAVSRRDRVGTWSRAIAGAVLAGAMTQWPYAHGCGGGLILYSLAAAAVVVVGIWGAAASWRSRSATAQILSLVITGWGIGLVAAVVLPRIGYAAVAQTWLCP